MVFKKSPGLDLANNNNVCVSLYGNSPTKHSMVMRSGEHLKKKSLTNNGAKYRTRLTERVHKRSQELQWTTYNRVITKQALVNHRNIAVAV